MIVKVRMLAFGTQGEVREVELPDTVPTDDLTTVLGQVFYYGQNDFQPKRHPSVSVGDVIEWQDELYLVCGAGFRHLRKGELEELEGMQRLERQFSTLCYSPNLDTRQKDSA